MRDASDFSILNIFKIDEFYWIIKMPTEFYYKIQYINFD